MYGKKINELVVECSSGEREGTCNHMYMYSMPSLTPYGDSFATFLQLQHMRFPFLLVQVSRPRKPRMKLADTTSGESSRGSFGYSSRFSTRSPLVPTWVSHDHSYYSYKYSPTSSNPLISSISKARWWRASSTQEALCLSVELKPILKPMPLNHANEGTAHEIYNAYDKASTSSELRVPAELTLACLTPKP